MKQRIGVLAAVAALAGGVLATGASAATHASKATVVTITMTDFHFKLSTTKFKKGVAYTIKEINKGAATHNFDIQGVKAGKVIPHGKTATFNVTFKKAGKFQYVCDVPRHAELGMAGYITVK